MSLNQGSDSGKSVGNERKSIDESKYDTEKCSDMVDKAIKFLQVENEYLRSNGKKPEYNDIGDATATMIKGLGILIPQSMITATNTDEVNYATSVEIAMMLLALFVKQKLIAPEAAVKIHYNIGQALLNKTTDTYNITLENTEALIGASQDASVKGMMKGMFAGAWGTVSKSIESVQKVTGIASKAADSEIINSYQMPAEMFIKLGISFISPIVLSTMIENYSDVSSTVSTIMTLSEYNKYALGLGVGGVLFMISRLSNKRLLSTVAKTTTIAFMSHSIGVLVQSTMEQFFPSAIPHMSSYLSSFVQAAGTAAMTLESSGTTHKVLTELSEKPPEERKAIMIEYQDAASNHIKANVPEIYQGAVEKKAWDETQNMAKNVGGMQVALDSSVRVQTVSTVITVMSLMLTFTMRWLAADYVTVCINAKEKLTGDVKAKQKVFEALTKLKRGLFYIPLMLAVGVVIMFYIVGTFSIDLFIQTLMNMVFIWFVSQVGGSIGSVVAGKAFGRGKKRRGSRGSRGSHSSRGARRSKTSQSRASQSQQLRALYKQLGAMHKSVKH